VRPSDTCEEYFKQYSPRLSDAQTVLVTGASSGIGAAAATLFARAGSNVILVARRMDKLQEVKELCIQAYKGNDGPGKIWTVQADIARKADVEGILGQLDGSKVDVCVLKELKRATDRCVNGLH
jgi:NADP-dependent 3-hydroxy acid dehydrogenase YdfG